MKASRVAVIGDAHGRWNHLDGRYFDEAGYDLLLFVGDLGSGTRGDGLSIIRQLARLRTPGLVLPGNNDAPHLPTLFAELAHQSGRASLQRLMGRSSPEGVRPAGYSRHELSTDGGAVTLIAGRPCSMGGPGIDFPELIERAYRIRSMEESILHLKQLVDEAHSSSLIFLSHNGPYGLGSKPADPFGRDFPINSEHEQPGDWGDEDLAAAVDYARTSGRRVLGVLAGHMHRQVRGGQRPFESNLAGVPCYNVAQVPRIRFVDGTSLHHHVELLLSPLEARVTEHWVRLSPT